MPDKRVGQGRSRHTGNRTRLTPPGPVLGHRRPEEPTRGVPRGVRVMGGLKNPCGECPVGSAVLTGRPWGLGGRWGCPGGPSGIYLEILDVFGAAELRQASGPHQGKEVEEQQPVASQDGVGAFAVTPESAGDAGRWEAGLRVLPTIPTLLGPWKPPPLRPPHPHLFLQDLTLSPARDHRPPPNPRAPSPFEFLTVVRLPLLDHVHKVISEDERDSLTVDSKLGLEIPQKVAKINVEELRRGKDEWSAMRGRGSGKGVRGGPGAPPTWPQALPLPARSHGS